MVEQLKNCLIKNIDVYNKIIKFIHNGVMIQMKYVKTFQLLTTKKVYHSYLFDEDFLDKKFVIYTHEYFNYIYNGDEFAIGNKVMIHKIHFD